MTEVDCEPVTVTRRIGAPAGVLFDILADPANHPRLDGAGMLRALVDPRVVRAVGDVFVVAMHNDEMGDYEMANHVVVFEPGRRIAWEPVLAKAGRPEDEDGVGERCHHVWGFELAPVGPDMTDVTERFDCSRSPEWLRRVLRDGERWREAMTATLENLARLAG
jgi:hypothetical protein